MRIANENYSPAEKEVAESGTPKYHFEDAVSRTTRDIHWKSDHLLNKNKALIGASQEKMQLDKQQRL